jgi:hypothetical protein
MNQALLMRSALIILGVALITEFLPVWRAIRRKVLDGIWG